MRRPSRLLRLACGVSTAAAAVLLFVLEKRRPLRRTTQREPHRTVRNLVLGAGSMAVVAALQRPLLEPLAARVERDRVGLAQHVPGAAWTRDLLAFLFLDWTIYIWHVLTHKIPVLWRFHVVHHADLDLDSTTALRFHALDMAISIPWRLAQVRLGGAGPRATLLWQTFFFLSVIFHHSNWRLPVELERLLVRVLTTPRLHGIHHSIVRGETGSNWSSGLSLWDWLHGTLRVDVPQRAVTIGLPGYRNPEDITLPRSLVLPFVRQPEAWRTPEGERIERDPAILRPTIFPE